MLPSFPSNLALPGNPRSQPKALIPIFGYDNLVKPAIEVEFATLEALGESGVIPASEIALLTPELKAHALRVITTTLVDYIERQDSEEFGKATKHDVRALVRALQAVLPEPLHRWVHVPLTSYDILDTARMLQFVRAHELVLRPALVEIMNCFFAQAMKYAKLPQIGRTHGQHALPITFGFWFATILSRVFANTKKMDMFVAELVGKISGAVGPHNAQVATGIYWKGQVPGTDTRKFDVRVLDKLGLKPALISTQIVPPEPLAYYLFSVVMMTAAFGQFGRDCRNLMRTEIAEIGEPFAEGQVGSSTMPHKRNPITFENMEGQFFKNKSELGKVTDTLISEHQRDLVGSTVMRDFPTILVNLAIQLNALLGKDESGQPFLRRLEVDEIMCRRNLQMQGDVILAEPLYILLQMNGYKHDAHHLVNHTVVKLARERKVSLIAALEATADADDEVAAAWESVPKEMKQLFYDPAQYVGVAEHKVLSVCDQTALYLNTGR